MLDIKTFKKKYDEQRTLKNKQQNEQSKPIIKSTYNKQKKTMDDKGLTYEEIDNFSILDDD